MNWRIEIGDDDIRGVESEMREHGLEEISFDDEERRAVLQCMETCDVQACPGSGKTTTLVAKLSILARKKPPDGRGICVLSHTNAARLVIENSLGKHASSLLSYPNFVGTIQSFVDRFLAIPAVISRFDTRPWAINDDMFEEVVARRYTEIPRKIRYHLEKRRGGVEFVKKVRYSFEDQSLCVYDGGRVRDFPVRQDTDTCKEVLSLKESITQEGCITYFDAYAWANWYLKQNPQLAIVISHRFPMVFVDEMQDTGSFQTQILTQVFERSIRQYFGDMNQSIYGARTSKVEAGWKPEPDRTLTISTSYRLSPLIAGVSRPVCVNPHPELKGNKKCEECRPTILLFDEASIEDVVLAFAEIIIQEELDRGPFKAVGAVGRPPENPVNYSISSYWPYFSKHRRPSSAQSSLKAYFDLARQKLHRRDGPGHCGEARECLIRGIVQVTRRQGFKRSNGHYYTPTSLLNALGELGEENLSAFRVQLVRWCTALANNRQLDWKQVLASVKSILSQLLMDDLNRQALEFLDANASASSEVIDCETGNLCQCRDICVELDTIHGVKGQTHQATLVLETFLQKVYDLKKLLPYIKGQTRRHDDASRRRLPLIYVAMTRPSDLLCLAIHRDHVEESDREELVAAGWHIMDLSRMPLPDDRDTVGLDITECSPE